MTIRTIKNPRRPALIATLGLVLAFIATGCGRDARLTGKELREPDVRTITAYGHTLDPDASPKEVVYVLLRAIADDYAAGKDREARDAALDTEFAVAAPANIIGTRGDHQDQLERYYRVVHNWAPTLGFYRNNFDADYETLAKRMFEVTPPPVEGQAEVTTIFVNLDHPDPESAGPNAGVVALFELVREQGYWRIRWLGYDSAVRDWHTRFGDPK
jgi:hypothetical protein